MIYQAIYSSAATVDFTDAAIEEMLAVARERNAAEGISGVLIFGEGILLQVLEGQKDAVVALLARIAKDPRHRNMKVFYRAEQTAPTFDGWKMAYISPDSAEMARWTGRSGMTTLMELRAEIEHRPDRLSHILNAIVRALSDA